MLLTIKDTEPKSERVFFIDCPFEKDQVMNDYAKRWKDRQVELYEECAGGVITAEYDFEEYENEELRLDILCGQYIDDRIHEKINN